MKHPTYFSCLISTIFIPLDQVLMLKSFTIENVYCFGTKYTFLHHFSKFSSNVDVNGTFHMPQWAHVHHMCYIRLSYNAWMLYNWHCILFCDWIHFFRDSGNIISIRKSVYTMSIFTWHKQMQFSNILLTIGVYFNLRHTL